MLLSVIPNFLFARDTSRPRLLVSLLLGLLIGGSQVTTAQTPTGQSATTTRSDLPPIPTGLQVKFAGPPTPLLAESGLGDWDTIDFAGGGESSVTAKTLEIGSGEGLTGIYWDGADLPVNNYELRMQARRTGGIDFFCGPVFPVNDSHCCFIVGGWAGATVGLSNIDDKDASRNETLRLMSFEDNRWYDIRIRVLPDRIITWIDNDCVVYQNIVGRKVSLRGDTELCTPMGICTFQTKAEIRKLTLQRISPTTKPTTNSTSKPTTIPSQPAKQ